MTLRTALRTALLLLLAAGFVWCLLGLGGRRVLSPALTDPAYVNVGAVSRDGHLVVLVGYR